MIKKLLKSALVAASMLAMVGSAHAMVELNLYGASAQYKVWSTEGPKFLQTLGCAAGDLYWAEGDVGDRDNGIAVCAGSEAVGSPAITGSGIGGETYVMRYTTNASYDGVRAVQCLNPDNVDNPPCSDPCTRQLGNEADASFVAYPNEPRGTVVSIKCVDVHIGASDVQAQTFNQQSEGYLLGCLGGEWTTRNISGLTVGSQYASLQPLVVPFAFFVNDAVPIPSASVPTLTPSMVKMLFRGFVANWNFFSPDLPSTQVVLCLRHAGSGTHATLDAIFGPGLVSSERDTGNILFRRGQAPAIYFNKGSSDMMRCIEQCAPPEGGQVHGAIGYADADKNVDGDFPTVSLMPLSGVNPLSSKHYVTNGIYTFWSAQNLYYDTTDDPAIVSLIQSLNAYASSAANLTNQYWATQDEMNVTKASDFADPTPK